MQLVEAPQRPGRRSSGRPCAGSSRTCSTIRSMRPRWMWPTCRADKTGAARSHYVYAVSARNDRIAACMKLFHDAGFPLQAIDVPEMAQRNIAALFEEPGRGLAMLAFDERGGLLTFTSGGELYMARQTDISLTPAHRASRRGARQRARPPGAGAAALARSLRPPVLLHHAVAPAAGARCRPTSACRSIWPRISTCRCRPSI